MLHRPVEFTRVVFSNPRNDGFVSETYRFRLSEPAATAGTEPSSPHRACVAETRVSDRRWWQMALGQVRDGVFTPGQDVYPD